MKWNRQRTLWVGQLSAFTTCFLYFGKGLKPANTTLLRRCEKNHLSSLCGTLQTQPSFFEVGKLTTKSFYRKWSGILAFKIFVFIYPIRHDKDVYKIKRFLHKQSITIINHLIFLNILVKKLVYMHKIGTPKI